jgi:hypothetical protein
VGGVAGRSRLGGMMRRPWYVGVTAGCALALVVASLATIAARGGKGHKLSTASQAVTLPATTARAGPAATRGATAGHAPTAAGQAPSAAATSAAGTSRAPAGSAQPTGPGSTTASTVAGQLIGVGNASQALAVGRLVYPQSTTRGPPPYASGVGNHTIKLDFGYDQNWCGVNVVDAISAAGGALPTPSQYYQGAPTTAQQNAQETAEAISALVQYFNQYAFQIASYFPNVRKYMGNDPNNPYFGRHLVAKLINAGSFQCPDVTTAAAKQAAEQDHAFAVVMNFGSTGLAAVNMDAALHAEPASIRPMGFGTLWLPNSTYQQWAPYDWTQFATGTTIVRQLASFVCSRLVGHPASYSPSSALQAKTRVFGLVHNNYPQTITLANELKGYLDQDCGHNIIAKEITYNGYDISSAETDATNMVVQLKLAGVTSVLMLTDPLFPLFQMDAAEQQDYYPEWIFSSYGYTDTSTVQRIYPQSEAAGSFGISNLGVFGGFSVDPGDAFKVWHTYHQVAPDGKPCDPNTPNGMDHDPSYCLAPGQIVTWYYSLLPLIGGILFAGPDLTPQNVTNGLQHYPPTRYGANGPTTDPRPALVGAHPGSFGFIRDAVEWRWVPSFTSPPPEDKAGWVSYPDCERHYFLWPNDLSPGWTGNVSQYCAGPNGYPPGPYVGF